MPGDQAKTQQFGSAAQALLQSSSAMPITTLSLVPEPQLTPYSEHRDVQLSGSELPISENPKGATYCHDDAFEASSSELDRSPHADTHHSLSARISFGRSTASKSKSSAGSPRAWPCVLSQVPSWPIQNFPLSRSRANISVDVAVASPLRHRCPSGWSDRQPSNV